MSTQAVNLLSTSVGASPFEVKKLNGLNSLVPFNPTSDSLVSSWTGAKISIQTSSTNRLVLKRRSTIMTISVSLPTTKSKEGLVEKMPRFSARAIKSFAMAECEARKLKYPNTGTEALLMGILVEGTSLAAIFLRDNGVTLFKVRDEIVNLLGKSDMYFFSPEHPPLTEPAQKAIDWAVEHKLKSGGESGEITTAYLLLGIWAQEDSAGRNILETFGFNDVKVKELSKNMDKDVILSLK